MISLIIVWSGMIIVYLNAVSRRIRVNRIRRRCSNEICDHAGHYLDQFNCLGQSVRQGAGQGCQDKGIECEVKIEKENGTLVAFSYTDDDGWVKDEIKCAKNEKIVFIPNDDYYTIYVRCPMSEKEVYVSSIKYGSNLLTNASRLLAAGEFGSAALAFSEAASRVKLHDANLSRDAETQAYEAAGKAFGVEQPTVIDRSRGKKSLSVRSCVRP